MQAAVFGIMWNRWTTARRFQGQGVCLLGCCADADQDRAEHYCRCRVVQDVCRRRLNLDPQTFANLHTILLVNPMINTTETLTTVALLGYGLYTTTNRLRHRQGCHCDDALDALMQTIKEATRGHSASSKVLNSRWSLERSSTPLPPLPLLPFEPQVARYRRMQGEANMERNVRARRSQ